MSTTCPGRRHGTANAYRNHGCRCPKAKLANGHYRSQLRAGIRSRESVSSVGLVRRRQALAAMGWGLADLAPMLKVGSLTWTKSSTSRASDATTPR